MDEVQQRRIAKNEDHFRQANEAIVDAMERFQGTEDHPLSLVCECGISECMDTVEASLREYAAVREHPTRFIVKPDHLIAQVETVVGRTDEHWIIQKLDAGAEEAATLFAEAHAEPSQDDEPESEPGPGSDPGRTA
jgi:hypothetical protein